MTQFEIDGVPVTVDKLRPDGHAHCGRIFADPFTPDMYTATYLHILPGDRYDVKANVDHPSVRFAASLGGSAPTLAGVVKTAKKWVSEYGQAKETVRPRYGALHSTFGYWYIWDSVEYREVHADHPNARCGIWQSQTKEEAERYAAQLNEDASETAGRPA